MKRILLWTGVGLTAAAIAAIVVLMLCTCVFGNHTYTAATCTEPEICTRCGATRGEPLGHIYSDPTCTEREICARCGERSGEALGHVWLPATCTEPETCARCNATQGEPLGHVMTEATYQTPASCTRCGETFGEPLPAALKDRTLNELQVGVPAPYITVSYEDYDVDVTGTAEIVDYTVIAGNDEYPAREGYEWHIATVQLVFDGEDAQQNGAQSAYTFGDYYLLDNSITSSADENGLRPFVCDWYGTRVQCWQKSGPNEEADWFDHELRFRWKEGVLVPEGYDGVLLILFSYRLAAHASHLFPNASKVLNDEALVFRMK